MDNEREAAIAEYKKLESELESTTSKRRTKTFIRELSELEMKHRLTYEEVHGKWKSGNSELDKAIELSERRTQMYILTDKPEGLNAAWETLDNAFGTEEFSREDALSTLSQTGISDDTFDRLVSEGYVSEV